MTIARITKTHPSGSLLPSLTATKPTANDNSQPCAASPIRAVEDSVVYVATRCQMSMGGSCRVSDFVKADSPASMFQTIAIEAYTAKVVVYFGVSSNGVGNSVSIGGTSYTIRQTNDQTAFAQHQRIVAPVVVGSGDKSDMGTVDLTFTLFIAAGNVRVWYAGPDPIPLPPGNVTVS